MRRWRRLGMAERYPGSCQRERESGESKGRAREKKSRKGKRKREREKMEREREERVPPPIVTIEVASLNCRLRAFNSRSKDRNDPSVPSRHRPLFPTSKLLLNSSHVPLNLPPSPPTPPPHLALPPPRRPPNSPCCTQPRCTGRGGGGGGDGSSNSSLFASLSATDHFAAL